MLALTLFRVRNFAVANVATLVVYAGLIGAFFFLTLFLQQIAGYSPIAAGFAAMPVSLMLFVLSPRFGAFADRDRAAAADARRADRRRGGAAAVAPGRRRSDYVTEVLPAILVFGLGLSATVAPLTATALNSVEERHAGIASGINNAVSRVAGLLAIAVLGALIAGQFGSTIDDRLAGKQLSPQARRAIDKAKEKPLATADSRGSRGRAATTWTTRSPMPRRRSLPSGGRRRRLADDLTGSEVDGRQRDRGVVS